MRRLLCTLALLPCLARAQEAAPAVVRTWGSVQMGGLMHEYEAGFHAAHPEIAFDDRLRSTITAVAGVYTGRADLGLLGRAIWPVEAEAYASIEGRQPTVIEVATGAYDVPKAAFALMVFVPAANPLRTLTLAQLEKIFGAGPHTVRTWGELGVRGAWARRPIHPYGFSIENDKSQSFAASVFRPGERWTPALHEFPPALGPHGEDAGELILRAAAADPDAIAISNVHYATPAVRALAIDGVTASKASVADRTYPLTRAVYMVVGLSPSAATIAFLRYVLSPAGDAAVLREGNYLPLPPAVRDRERATLDALQAATAKR